MSNKSQNDYYDDQNFFNQNSTKQFYEFLEKRNDERIQLAEKYATQYHDDDINSYTQHQQNIKKIKKKYTLNNTILEEKEGIQSNSIDNQSASHNNKHLLQEAKELVQSVQSRLKDISSITRDDIINTLISCFEKNTIDSDEFVAEFFASEIGKTLEPMWHLNKQTSEMEKNCGVCI